MPERIKADNTEYNFLMTLGADQLKEYIKNKSRNVSKLLFDAEALLEEARRDRQLIAIGEKQLDALTTRVPKAGSSSVNVSINANKADYDISDEVDTALASIPPRAVETSVDMGNGIRVPATMIVGFDDIMAGKYDAPEPHETTPLPTTESIERHPDHRVGGRPTEIILSTKDWLKVMESREGARDVALYHDRSETGLIRTRTRALAGQFPESKWRQNIFQMLADGYAVDEVADTFNRDIRWTQNVANYLTAIVARKKAGQDVPELGVDF